MNDLQLTTEIMRILDTKQYAIHYQPIKDERLRSSMACYFAKSEEEAIGKYYKEFSTTSNILRVDLLD